MTDQLIFFQEDKDYRKEKEEESKVRRDAERRKPPRVEQILNELPMAWNREEK